MSGRIVHKKNRAAEYEAHNNEIEAEGEADKKEIEAQRNEADKKEIEAQRNEAHNKEIEAQKLNVFTEELFDSSGTFIISDNQISGFSDQAEELRFDTPVAIHAIAETINACVEAFKKSVHRELTTSMKQDQLDDFLLRCTKQ